MKILLLLLVPISLYGSAPEQNKKYTAEQLRDLKPPLNAQQYTLKPKKFSPSNPHACWPPSSMPALDLNHALASIPEVQSPSSYRKKLKKPSHTPKNSMDLSRLSKSDPGLYLSAAAANIIPPFPEIVITFEAISEGKAAQ